MACPDEQIDDKDDRGGSVVSINATDTVSLMQLLAGSATFRQFLLNLSTDDMLCQLLQTPLQHALNERQLKLLASCADEETIHQGNYIIHPQVSPFGSNRSNCSFLRQ